MVNRKNSLIAGVSVLTLVILACTVNIGGPAYPTPAIPISTEAVGDLRSTLEAAVSAVSPSGQITLTITEAQLTSYLTYQIQTQTQPILSNIQVYLQE
jgi:hypothetical protein